LTVRHLEHLLSPAAVAVIGASERAGSAGAIAWRNLHAGGFAGPILAVNPKHASLDGQPVFARVSRLPQAPDLAVVCTPARTVARLVAELGARGTRAVVVTTALDTAQTQAALDAARPHRLRILGPGSLGVLSPHIGLDASLAPGGAAAGELAFVSQSGTLASAVLGWGRSHGIGFSHAVSLGGHGDVDTGDMLDFLASDARTRAILLYVESVESPRKFMSAARAAARNKPVILVKAGRSGAAAAPDAVCDAAIRRAGMLRVDTLRDLFLAAESLTRLRANRSEALSIVSNSAGAAAMARDAAAMAGIALAEPGEPQRIGRDAPPPDHAGALSARLADPSAGAVLFIHAPSAAVGSEEVAHACLPLVRAAPSRVMAVWLGGDAASQARRLFVQAGVPDYATPEEAVRAFAMLGTYRRNQEILVEMPSAREAPAPDAAAARRGLDAASADGREWLGAQEVRAVLGAYGIPAADAPAEPPPREAVDIAIRTRIDAVFGPVILCGPVGTENAAVALPPLNRSLARELVSRARLPEAPVEADALHDALVAVSQMLADLPHLAELVIDPLRIGASGAVAVDARLRVAASPAGGAARFAILPYPSEWVRTCVWHGRELTIRPIRPEDEPQHRRFLASLDPEDVRMRFFQARRELPRSELARLTQIDYDREMAFIAEATDAQGLRETLGVARTVSDPDRVEAEFGIIVRSELKGMGLGKLLFDLLIAHARYSGIGRLVGIVLRENTRMLKLAQSLGFKADPAEPPGSGLRRMVRTLNGPADTGPPAQVLRQIKPPARRRH